MPGSRACKTPIAGRGSSEDDERGLEQRDRPTPPDRRAGPGGRGCRHRGAHIENLFPLVRVGLSGARAARCRSWPNVGRHAGIGMERPVARAFDCSRRLRPGRQTCLEISSPGWTAPGAALGFPALRRQVAKIAWLFRLRPRRISASFSASGRRGRAPPDDAAQDSRSLLRSKNGESEVVLPIRSVRGISAARCRAQAVAGRRSGATAQERSPTASRNFRRERRRRPAR